MGNWSIKGAQDVAVDVWNFSDSFTDAYKNTDKNLDIVFRIEGNLNIRERDRIQTFKGQVLDFEPEIIL